MIPRIVVPGIPHHIIKRGHRRQKVFFSDEDRALYLSLLKSHGDEYGVDFWAYCLMSNHVHLIAVPHYADSLAKALGRAHWKFSLLINLRQDWKGHLWQGRFDSYPMDDDHLANAVRYAETNPVRAGIAASADAYPWSSAAAHVSDVPDPLITGRPFGMSKDDWRHYLGLGSPKSDAREIRDHLRSGRPFGGEPFLEKLESLTGKTLRKKKPGPKRGARLKQQEAR